MKFVLTSKIHGATVTESNLAYTGSIGIDQDLIDAVGLWEGEKVLVASLTSGSRLETYVISAERGSGSICINGAASHLIGKGENVIIMGFSLSPKPLEARIVFTDEKNRIKNGLLEVQGV